MELNPLVLLRERNNEIGKTCYLFINVSTEQLKSINNNTLTHDLNNSLSLSLSRGVGGINRVAAAVPAFLRTPTVIQPPLDMKPFLQFSMETAPPPHSMGLFHNFNTVSIDTYLQINNIYYIHQRVHL